MRARDSFCLAVADKLCAFLCLLVLYTRYKTSNSAAQAALSNGKVAAHEALTNGIARADTNGHAQYSSRELADHSLPNRKTQLARHDAELAAAKQAAQGDSGPVCPWAARMHGKLRYARRCVPAPVDGRILAAQKALHAFGKAHGVESSALTEHSSAMGLDAASIEQKAQLVTEVQLLSILSLVAAASNSFLVKRTGPSRSTPVLCLGCRACRSSKTTLAGWFRPRQTPECSTGTTEVRGPHHQSPSNWCLALFRQERMTFCCRMVQW